MYVRNYGDGFGLRGSYEFGQSGFYGFGGWNQVNKEFFGDGGIWDRLFANTR